MILTAFSLNFFKVENKKDRLLSLNAPLPGAGAWPGVLVLEMVATVGHQCPPPLPSIALHEASHEVLQENLLGVTSLYRGHVGRHCTCLFARSEKAMHEREMYSETGAMKSYITDWPVLCTLYLKKTSQMAFMLANIFCPNIPKGSDLFPMTQSNESVVFHRGHALWEPWESRWVE